MLKFKDLFVSELEDHVQKLNDNLLLLEKDPKNNYILKELMRSAHTIKGASATMGYTKLAFLTHILEDVFDYTCNGVIELDHKTIEVIYSAVDAIDDDMESIKISGKEKNVDEISEKIKNITGVETKGIGKSIRSESGNPIVVKEKKEIKKGEVVAEEDKKTDIIEKIEQMDHIKVPVERLDSLMEITEELLVDKMRLKMIIDEKLSRVDLNESKHSDSREYIILKELKPVVDHLNGLVVNLQYNVMKARLVSVGQVFARFPRMIRDLSTKQNKDVKFELFGGDTELDRTIIDRLANPLVHLLRNAVDHGIEKKGKIILRALREKDFSIIAVENIGNSVDWLKVVQKAQKIGLITAEKAKVYENALKKVEEQVNNPIASSYVYPPEMKEIKNLIFNSNLSTRDVVTETSGRGVGLSVVKDFVNQIGGRVEVESPIPGGGARFVMELPSTLAIINALLVSTGSHTYAIPFSSIEKSVIVKKENIKSMADQDMAIVGDRNIPLVDLNKIFKIKGAGSDDDLIEERIVVLVERGKQVAGIIVDKLDNEQEIIVKPFSSILSKVKGFSGSTILGDGRTILILDIISLLEDASQLVRTSNFVALKSNIK